ncbi:MAG: M20/M25/M40 family metallo-hydrolase [Bryobacteraceae bacterium]
MRSNRFLLFAAVIAATAAEVRAPHLAPEAYREHVKVLASPEMRGRGSGMPELEKAASYIARQFEQSGLRVAAEEPKKYMQAFEVTTNPRLGKSNELSWQVAGKHGKANGLKDFTPFNFSNSGKFEGAVVFAGYGITAHEYGYDDYAGIDVKDKFVLVLRHEPGEFDDKSVFAGKIYTEHAQFSSKATNAKMHGARGVLLVNDIANHAADGDELEPFSKTVGPGQAGIPFVQIKASIADELLAPSGKDLRTLDTAIDEAGRPESFALPDTVRVALRVDMKRETKTVHNVSAYLPGETDEYVVVGAHYDHLGLGEQFSMAPSEAGKIHPGADDNASGTAGVIELAKYFAAKGRQKRGILFLAFAGEELGLLGSAHWVNHPELPIDKAVAMINMDMIGRIRDGKVYVGGLGTGSNFEALMNDAAKTTTLKLEFSDRTGYGSSDHTSFTTKQVPVLFFFSGLHADYHKPSDTWDKIEAGPAVNLLETVAGVVTRLANDPGRPEFVKVAEPARPVSASDPHSGSAPGRGYGPYFGSIPDMAERTDGVLFADVREGSPAAKAGLKAGDRMVEFDAKPIQNLYDFTYALRGKKPGDAVKVKAIRDGKPMEVDVVLEQRR